MFILLKHTLNQFKELFRTSTESEIKKTELDIEYYKSLTQQHLEEMEYNKKKLAKLQMD